MYETRNHYRKKNGKKHRHTETKQHATKHDELNEEIKQEIRIYLEMNESGDKTFQNQWYTAQPVLRGKCRVIQAYLKKQEKYQINNLTFYQNRLEKEEQTKPKVIRRKK